MKRHFCRSLAGPAEERLFGKRTLTCTKKKHQTRTEVQVIPLFSGRITWFIPTRELAQKERSYTWGDGHGRSTGGWSSDTIVSFWEKADGSAWGRLVDRDSI